MRAYETVTEATRRRIRKAHSKIKFVGFMYLLGIIALAVLAFLPAVKVNGVELSITNFYKPITAMFSGDVDYLGLFVAFFYTCIILTVVINVFKAFAKLGRLFKKTARYVRLNRNLDAMEDLARIYSGSFGAIVNFTFLICVFSSFENIVLLGYITLAVGLFFHFLCGCCGGTISTFTSRASIEENQRKCGLFVYFIRNFLQLIALALIYVFFMETNIVYASLVAIFDGNIAALTNDIFVLIVFVLQVLLVLWLLVLAKHATASTEYNIWGSEGPGMLNFRVFSFFSFITALGIGVVVLVFLKDKVLDWKYNYLYIAGICLVMFVLDCLLKSVAQEEEDVDMPPMPMQRPMMPPMMAAAPTMQPAQTFMPPVICVNTVAQPPMDPVLQQPAPISEEPVIPDTLPEELPPDENAVSEWQVTCPSCNAELMVKDGQYHRCPCCSKVFQVRKTKKAVIK